MSNPSNETLSYAETESIAAYLISLFYKSGMIYSSSRPKINKLLILHSLCNKKHPELLDSLFISNAGIYNVTSYYATIIPRDVYIGSSFRDDNIPYKGTFNDNVKIPYTYQKRLNDYPLDDYTKRLLEDIFKNFASYKLDDLVRLSTEAEKTVYRTNDGNNIVIKQDENTNVSPENKIFEYLRSKTEKTKCSTTDIFNFYIHLYDKINGVYFCNYLKLQKLAILAIIKHYEDFEEILTEDGSITYDENKGLKLDTANIFTRDPITISMITINIPMPNINRKVLEAHRESKIYGFDEDKILKSDNTKNTLIDTFINYGAYDTRTLCEIVDSYTNEEYVSSKTNEGERYIPININTINKIFDTGYKRAYKKEMNN